jgi:hypothetical protein
MPYNANDQRTPEQRYVKRFWPDGVPFQCTRPTDRKTCLDTQTAKPCPSCLAYEQLSGEAKDLCFIDPTAGAYSHDQ